MKMSQILGSIKKWTKYNKMLMNDLIDYIILIFMEERPEYDFS